MIRIYWTQTSAVDHATKSKKTIQRWEGGWWFSEEVDSSNRSTYQVVDRLDYTEKMDGCFIELLKPLPSDFVESPCWKEAAPMCWSLLFENSEGVSLLAATAAGAAALEQQLLLWFPVSYNLSSLPSEVLSQLETPKTLLCAIFPEVQTLLGSNRNLLSSHDTHVQTPAIKSEEPLLHTVLPHQDHNTSHGLQNKKNSVPSVKKTQPAHAVSQQKGIQTGSLCQPVTLQEKGYVQETNSQQKKVSRKPRAQTQPTRCLIQLTEA